MSRLELTVGRAALAWWRWRDQDSHGFGWYLVYLMAIAAWSLLLFLPGD